MKVVLINQFYPPSRAPTGRLLGDLADALAAREHEVHVLTSATTYDQMSANDTRPEKDGLHVTRLGRPRTHQTGYVSKAVDYGRFFSAARRHLRRMRPLPDAVLCMTTPPFCASLGYQLHRRHRVPYVVWCMDLYPEALAADGLLPTNRWLYRMLMRRARREREQAAAVVTLAGDMSHRIRQTAPQSAIKEIPVWHAGPTSEATAAAQRLRAERGWGDTEQIFMYSGNIGRAHNWDAFASLPDALASAAVPARVVFCGRGPAQAAAKARLPASVEWIDPVPDDQLDAHLLSADIHLIAQRAAWKGIVVPSKYQAACAMGRPVLYAGPTDSAVARWIHSCGTGWCWPDAQSTTGGFEVSAEEIKLRGRAAQDHWQNAFIPHLALTHWIELIENRIKHQ